jgi:hypothetical protein
MRYQFIPQVINGTGIVRTLGTIAYLEASPLFNRLTALSAIDQKGLTSLPKRQQRGTLIPS